MKNSNENYKGGKVQRHRFVNRKNIYLLQYDGFYSVVIVDEDNFTVIHSELYFDWKESLERYNCVKDGIIKGTID